jgi:hypothetical protein
MLPELLGVLPPSASSPTYTNQGNECTNRQNILPHLNLGWVANIEKTISKTNFKLSKLRASRDCSLVTQH